MTFGIYPANTGVKDSGFALRAPRNDIIAP
jgi:hypothetical protein